jgi:hypothetical protein
MKNLLFLNENPLIRMIYHYINISLQLDPLFQTIDHCLLPRFVEISTTAIGVLLLNCAHSSQMALFVFDRQILGEEWSYQLSCLWYCLLATVDQWRWWSLHQSSVFFSLRQVQISCFFSVRVRDSEFLGFIRPEILVSRALLLLKKITKLLLYQIIVLSWLFILLFIFYSN